MRNGLFEKFICNVKKKKKEEGQRRHEGAIYDRQTAADSFVGGSKEYFEEGSLV